MKISAEDNDSLHPEELEKLLALLDRYARAECTEEERQAVEQWYESLSGERELDTSGEHFSKARIWNTIHRDTIEKNETPVRSLSWVRWAAAIIILSVVGIFSIAKFAGSPSVAHSTTDDGWIEKSNTSHQPDTIALPDGSRVALQPGASLRFAENFNNDKERLVIFKGNGFFDVKKDPSRPFKVLTGDITTRVLGTSFTVKADEHASTVEVDVRTGRVSVYQGTQNTTHTTSDKNEGVILTPNQKVTYYKNESKWVTELVQNPVPVTPEQGEVPSMVYKDISMRQVLADVAAVYGTEIMVSSERIYHCPFTGDLSHMGLHDVMKVLCNSIRAEYETKGTRLLITGTGCTATSESPTH